MIRGTRNTSVLTTMLPSYMNDCGKHLKRFKCSPHQRQRDRSGTTIGKLVQFHWNQVTWIWLKLMPMGEEESEGLVEGGTIQSGVPSCRQHPFLPHEEPADRTLMSPPPKLTFYHHSQQRGLPSVWLCRLSGPGAPSPH